MIALGFLFASTVYADTEAALAPLLMSQFEAYGLHERSAAAVARSYLALAWESLDSATSKALMDAAASKLDPIAEEWETFSTASSDDCRAGQVLSSLTGVPGELAVTWQTYAPLDQGSSVQTPEGQSFIATERHYDVNTTQWLGWAPYTYGATLSGLQADAKVSYTVNGSCSGVQVELGPFEAQVPFVPDKNASQPSRSTVVALWGDQGVFVPLGWAVEGAMQEDYGLDTKSGTVSGKLDARIVVGDISYAGLDISVPSLNITNGDEEEAIWDLYGMQQSALGARRPFMVTFGNHDNFYNAIAFQNRYATPSTRFGRKALLPSETRAIGSDTADAAPGHDAASKPNVQPSGSPFWYAFEVGNAHFLSLSSEHDYSKGSPQWLYAEQDLKAAAANRANVPWIVVNFHRPMYSSYTAEYPAHHQGGLLQVDLEALFIEHGVNLVISGHIHSRERVHPVNNGTVTNFPTNISTPRGPSQLYKNPAAPAHICAATGGALQEDSWVEPKPQWSAVRASGWLDSYGYVHLEFANSTHMLAETRGLAPVPNNRTRIGQQAVLEELAASGTRVVLDGSHVVDSFWIEKSG